MKSGKQRRQKRKQRLAFSKKVNLMCKPFSLDILESRFNNAVMFRQLMGSFKNNWKLLHSKHTHRKIKRGYLKEMVSVIYNESIGDRVSIPISTGTEPHGN